MNKLIFGADPETFASENIGGKDFVVPPVLFRTELGCAIERASKKHPVLKVIPVDGGEILVHEDGAAFELSVPPRQSLSEVFDNIQIGYGFLESIVGQFGYFHNPVPAINFDCNKYTSRDLRFQMCLIFGCDPDGDVFEMEGLIEPRPVEENAMKHPFRYAGGHIHISGSSLIKQKPLLAIKMLAFTVGQYVMGNSPVPELDFLRVYRYGRPGRFRIQRYGKLWNDIPDTDIGIEYRTPSNAWTRDKSMAEKIQHLVDIAINKFLPDDSLMQKLIDDVQQPALESIMTGNFDLSKQVLSRALSM